MAELKLDIVFENLNKLKSSLENISIGSKGTDTKKESGGKSTGALMAGGFAFLGGLLGGVIGQLESVQAIMKVIGGLINSFVAPFIPILLGLMKPVFILLQVFLKKMLQSLGYTPDENSQLPSFGEKITKIILAAIAAVGVGILAAVAGAGAIMATVIGLIVASLAIFAVDLGKALGEKIGEFSSWIADKLFSMASKLDNILGTGFIDSLMLWADGILNIFSGLWNILQGVFTLDWETVKTGIMKVFKGIIQIMSGSLLWIINIMKGIFVAAWKILSNIFSWLMGKLSDVIGWFARKFIDGLNAIIGLLNKIPGVDIGRIRGGTDTRSLNTSININIEGSADEKTVNSVITRLRAEMNKRGAF